MLLNGTVNLMEKLDASYATVKADWTLHVLRIVHMQLTKWSPKNIQDYLITMGHLTNRRASLTVYAREFGGASTSASIDS